MHARFDRFLQKVIYAIRLVLGLPMLPAQRFSQRLAGETVITTAPTEQPPRKLSGKRTVLRQHLESDV
ncbi:hypothetical protein BCEP27_90043 [Burkholderia cepacia]